MDLEHVEKKLENVKSKEDFLSFVRSLIVVLKNANDTDWPNNKLDLYLDAVADWTEDSEYCYKNLKLPVPENVDWNYFASILLAAVDYE